MREWPVLNTRLGWTAFNLLFISFYQNFLLLSLAFPALYSALSPASLGLLDLLISVTFLLLVLVETLADNQQEDFQNEKYRQLRYRLVHPDVQDCSEELPRQQSFAIRAPLCHKESASSKQNTPSRGLWMPELVLYGKDC